MKKKKTKEQKIKIYKTALKIDKNRIIRNKFLGI